jgi:hypothetical protein
MRPAAEFNPSAGVVVEIGGLPILLRSQNASFRKMLQQRYRGFTTPTSQPGFEFEISLRESGLTFDPDADVQLQRQNDHWLLTRGDFLAEWEPGARRGRILQSPNPFSVDSVLRIIHTLVLARQGGFLLHAASVVRNERAFLFAGVSGAGKTTISRMAPPDVTLLTDEISYIRHQSDGYRACGTPFAGELARAGQNMSAPIATLFLLDKGPRHRVEPVDRGEALRSVLRNILFFAEDQELVKGVFQSACDFVQTVPVQRLIFAPDQRVWELIG